MNPMINADDRSTFLSCLHAGACEGSVACSTCHVILEPTVFDQLPEATDEENDMLDLAFGLTETYGPLCAIVPEPRDVWFSGSHSSAPIYSYPRSYDISQIAAWVPSKAVQRV